MSRIEDLIAKHCPNGVDYLRISDLGDFVSGLKGKTKADFTDGNAKFVSYKNVFDNIEVDFSDLKSVKINVGERQTSLRRGDLIFTSSSENLDESGMTSVVTKDVKEDILLNSFCFFVHLPDSIKPEFAKYLFRSTGMRKQIIKCANGVTRYNISKKALEKIKFPVPPLEVQDEIVRILDSFTKLEAELEARRQQYEHYRDSLRDVSNQENRLGKKVEIIALEETCDISAGGDAPKESMCKSKTDKYKVPIISNGIGENALYGYTDIAKINTPAVTIAARGTIGYAEYRDYPYFPIIRLLTAIPKDNSFLNTKYLYYCLQGKKYQLPNGGIPQLTAPQLKKVKIPVPPLTEQERIVAILDKFDALVNDLSSGLPAEIAARRKQYEYYRDQLLTFTPAK